MHNRGADKARMGTDSADDWILAMSAKRRQQQVRHPSLSISSGSVRTEQRARRLDIVALAVWSRIAQRADFRIQCRTPRLAVSRNHVFTPPADRKLEPPVWLAASPHSAASDLCAWQRLKQVLDCCLMHERYRVYQSFGRADQKRCERPPLSLRNADNRLLDLSARLSAALEL